jgi:hypothetical protein
MSGFTLHTQYWDPDMWREALKAVVRFTAQPHENLDDIVTAGWLLGQKRAELRHRDFWPGVDAQHLLMILCWWPFKPAYSLDELEIILSSRWELVEGIDQSHDVGRIEEVIPDELLSLEVSDLYSGIMSGEVGRTLRWPGAPTGAPLLLS